MDSQTFITILVGIIQIGLGFFLSTLWGMIRTLETRVNSIEVTLATQDSDIKYIKDSVDHLVKLMEEYNGRHL